MLKVGEEFIIGSSGETWKCVSICGGQASVVLIRDKHATMEYLLNSNQAKAATFHIQQGKDDLQHKTSLWLENSVLKQNKKGDGDKSVKQTRGKGRI
jgi:hypothetical protein